MDSELIENLLKIYNKNKNNFFYKTIFKKKKIKLFQFREGILNFNVIINTTFKCNYCRNKICIHILHILIDYYNITYNQIDYVLIFDIWGKIWNNKFAKIDDIIIKYLNDNECGMCLEKLIDEKLFQCKFCYQLSHKKCINKWFKEKKRICIYCNRSYINNMF